MVWYELKFNERIECGIIASIFAYFGIWIISGNVNNIKFLSSTIVTFLIIEAVFIIIKNLQKVK